MRRLAVVVAVGSEAEARELSEALAEQGHESWVARPDQLQDVASRFPPPSPSPLPLPLFPQTPISPSPITPSPEPSPIPATRGKKRVASGAHAAFIERFCELWREKRRGGEYRVVGGRDGKAVKSLLSLPEATPVELERRLQIAFSHPWFLGNGNIAVFVSRWSNYDRPWVERVSGNGGVMPMPTRRTVATLEDVMAASTGGRR